MKTLQLLIALFFGMAVYGQQTQSPYLRILTKNANIPLKSSNAKVQISGTIAHVQITQVYQNLGKKPIEAEYVFPLSTMAAVHKMDMSIGDRTIHAKIYEKKKAKVIYDKAIKSGKRAAKLDQERPNVFKMNVGNILPNDEITIDIFYTELLVPTVGEYEFVLPSVVGPRFTGESKSNETTFGLAYATSGISETFTYNFNLCLDAGMPIQKITSNTHKININYADKTSAEIYLSKNNEQPSNRDFILKYALRGNKINSGLLLYEGKDENFFAYLMEPPAKTTIKQIPPREYVFIVDVSGSMRGYPLDVSKKLMRNLLGNLRAVDSFNILVFAGSSDVFKTMPVIANSENITEAMQFISGNFGGGGTRLLQALNKAYSLPRLHANNSRSMVIITDGYVSVEKRAFQIIKDNLNQANVFTFGIGSSVNRHLINGMAKVSNSESFIATNEDDAYKMAEKFKNYIETPVLTQIKLETEGFEIYDMEPSSISDVFASRPILVFGKWKGDAKGKIIVSGNQGSGKFRKEYNIAKASLSKNNVALKYLWARKKIELLDDYNLANSNSKQSVIDLGLKYNLLTQYTSFVAVDNEIVNKDGYVKTIKQPLPMPKNVSNSAVGAEASVKGKTLAKKSYHISITSQNMTKSFERQLKMWFKFNYSDFIKTQLNIYDAIKIHFDKNGLVTKIDVKKDGKWTQNAALKQLLLTKPIKAQNITKSMSVIFKY
jgi:Ca-activated chloride channel family protein